MKEPQTIIFQDDGLIPNSGHPVLLFRRAVDLEDVDPASSMEERFAANHWTNSWRNLQVSSLSQHESRSTRHLPWLGHSPTRVAHGQDFIVEPGDVIVIPAGVGHKNMGSSPDLGVVGAYPDGRRCDLLRGRPGERPQAEQNIAVIPTPNQDPLYGPDGPLMRIWVR
jgi:uncharacterized protein YjlB